MPRKGRGGERQGASGTAYGNRTDLNNPISTVPNQEYGKATSQMNAQRAVPMGESPVAAAPATAAAPSAPTPQPGSMPHLEETLRPNEPITAGLPFGPGAGTEALSPQYATFGQTLSEVASRPNASAYSMRMAESARALGL